MTALKVGLGRSDVLIYRPDGDELILIKVRMAMDGWWRRPYSDLGRLVGQ